MSHLPEVFLDRYLCLMHLRMQYVAISPLSNISIDLQPMVEMYWLSQVFTIEAMLAVTVASLRSPYLSSEVIVSYAEQPQAHRVAVVEWKESYNSESTRECKIGVKELRRPLIEINSLPVLRSNGCWQ